MRNAKINTEDKDNNYLSKIVFRYLPYWPLFVLLVMIAVAGAWLYLRFQTPLYQSTARLMIKDEKKGTENTKALDDLNLISIKKIVENEIEVIQSRTLLNNVVRKLSLYAPVYEVSRFRLIPAYKTSPITVEVIDPEKLVKQKRVDFTFDETSKKVQIGSATYPLNKWVNTEYGTLRFLPNERLVEKSSGELYFSLVSLKDAASSILGRLTVKAPNKQASILNLSLLDEVPERGEDILNELITNYNSAIIKDKNVLAANTLAFVEERLKAVEKDLDSIEKRTQQYRSRRGAINISEQGKLFLQNVAINDQKLADINMQLASLGQVENYVQSKDAQSGIVPSTLGVDPMLSQLLTKLYTAEVEYESLKKTTGEGNPQMLALARQIQSMRPSILENIRTQKQGLLASRSNLAATNGSYNAMLQTIPETEREMIDINREQSIKNGIYSFLLQKREETALSQASTVSDSRIIDAAESSVSPVSPKPKVIYLSSLLLALGCGIGVVAARESLSRKILFRHEIETLTTQPIIGEIVAENNSKDPIVIGETNKTFIAEQFRRLRTTLKFVGINSRNKRILVTSAISGEGKSFVATNLALSLALTGKKVVLIDCDLNNPSLNNKLRIHNEKGITEFLLGKSEAEDIIRETDLNENLFLISTGALPHNPSELIMSERMEELLNRLDTLFDFIVIDTAPVSPVTDAYILSPLCSATLFVIRHKYTPKVFVQRIDEENKMSQLKNLAIVFNGIQSRGFGNKNYGYGYGYGYIFKDRDDRYQQLGLKN
ncbi:MAG TPA: polysaccharide biosynthesis tyrosine autokinase [Flavisolibacter sp.]|nr:polysaccharide biosynthesis tyrosine autokinase [Flavisolibacter sp.]